ncbi:hypothetical protein [Sinomonas cellulolyticus]|uniref:Integral membrane protein n=1 Tax=Sinomonas cellulolyticus TaxID=2801916 RepID=A0ABS1JZR4_9MICC|nr:MULTISPECIES: hypothetical protein [Sinomonas]MBL0704899.1 hypothetical protein [Sinomonas cellulolyticus]
MPPTQPPSPAGPSSRPWTLVALVAIVLLEAAVLAGFAVFYLVSLVAGAAATSPGGAAFTLVLLAAFAAWLATAGLSLWRGRRWPRSAVLVTQLFALTIGVPTLTSGVVGFGLAILIPAAAALILLFERRVLSITQGSGPPRSRGNSSETGEPGPGGRGRR